MLSSIKSFHAGVAFGNIQIERTIAEALREDQLGHLPLLVGICELMLEEDQQQGERCKSLLTINDELLAVFVADDDGAQEIVSVPCDSAPLIPLLVAFEELARQVVDQFGHLL